VFLLGIGWIVLGLPIMFLIARRQEQKPFFRGESLHHDTPVLAPEWPAGASPINQSFAETRQSTKI
jgi:hypothetical protein